MTAVGKKAKGLVRGSAVSSEGRKPYAAFVADERTATDNILRLASAAIGIFSHRLIRCRGGSAERMDDWEEMERVG